MKKFFSAAALTFIVTAFCHAAGYSVRGTVADSIGEPEAYATVRVYPHADTAKVTAHGITADDGSFSLSLKTPGQYLLKIISIGRTPVSRGFSVSAQAPLPISARLPSGPTIKCSTRSPSPPPNRS